MLNLPSKPSPSLLPGFRLRFDSRIALPLVTLLLFAVIGIVTFHFIDAARDAARRAAVDSVRELVDTYEAQVARTLDDIDQTLKVIQFAVAEKGTRDALPELSRQGLLPSALVFAVSIADRDGNVVSSNADTVSGPRHLSIAMRSYFQYHQANDSGKPFVSQPLRDAPDREWNLFFSRRLNDAAGRFAGIAAIEVSPGYFTSGYERSRMGEHGLLGLFGVDGTLRSLRIGDNTAWNEQATPARDAALAQRLSHPSGELPGASYWDGKHRYTEVRRLRGFPLSAVVGLSETEQMATFELRRRTTLWQAGIGSASLLVLIAVLWLWSWQGGRARRRIRRAQETYAAASEANVDSFFVLRSICNRHGDILDFKIVAANARARAMTNMHEHEIRGMTLCALLPQIRSNGIFDSMVQVTTNGGVYEEEWENHMPQLRAKWLHRQVVGVENGVVAIIRDISERKQTEERMLHLAQHDGLTGLPNRDLLEQKLEHAMHHARQVQGMLLVAFIDLDGFKLVNDGLGHKAGDELLQVVAQRLCDCLRPYDIVGRFGGDEFVLVLPVDGGEAAGMDAERESGRDRDADGDRDGAPGGEAGLLPALERIRNAVTEPVMLRGRQVHVSCSVGVAIFPRDGDSADTLLINSDAAMYRAKEAGKNNTRFYAGDMNGDVADKLAMREGLAAALLHGQFRVLYQPKVDLNSGLILGVEALVRWQHPEQGCISPLRFIPLAEESGMIVAIGAWVLRTACRQNQAWCEAGLPPLTVSVNVSPRQFDDVDLVALVASALRESGLAPERLELEITESLIMRDMPRAVARMRELNAMSVSLSIDDFGTGYSSLAALKSFPISGLKIDQSFVRDLATSADDRTIAMAIISLAHQLNMRVIAEGVETVQQRDFLRDNLCDEMQGYLFSAPVPAADIQCMLERQAAAVALSELKMYRDGTAGPVLPATLAP